MAVPHSGIPSPDPAPQDATVDDLTAATLTVTGASTLDTVTATSVSAPHSGLTGVTADQHHTQSHGHTGADGSGTVAHSATTGQTANDHHAQSHVVTGADHTASGLTAGHVLRATGATTFAFGAIADEDVPATIARDTEVTSAVTTHEADTTDIHGIADTSLLAVQAVYSGWTPALTATTTSPTLGTGSSAQGRYFQNGKHVVAYGSINFGTSGTAAGTGDYQISLPVTARTRVNNDMNMIGQGYLFDSSASALRPCIFIYVDTGKVGIRLTTDGSLVTAAAPWAWAASDVLIFHFDYEAA